MAYCHFGRATWTRMLGARPRASAEFASAASGYCDTPPPPCSWHGSALSLWSNTLLCKCGPRAGIKARELGWTLSCSKRTLPTFWRKLLFLLLAHSTTFTLLAPHTTRHNGHLRHAPDILLRVRTPRRSSRTGAYHKLDAQQPVGNAAGGMRSRMSTTGSHFAPHA